MEMDELLRRLYINLIQEMEPEDVLNMKLREEIKKILEEGGQIKTLEYESYRDKAFKIASAAEESGFVRGFRYAFQLMQECSQK